MEFIYKVQNGISINIKSTNELKINYIIIFQLFILQ